MMRSSPPNFPLTGEDGPVRDIYELIRQRETEIDHLDKEVGRIEKELEALRLTAKLLDDTTAVNRPVAVSGSPVTREAVAQSAAPAPQPITAAVSAPTTGAWASAKQFP